MPQAPADRAGAVRHRSIQKSIQSILQVPVSHSAAALRRAHAPSLHERRRAYDDYGRSWDNLGLSQKGLTIVDESVSGVVPKGTLPLRVHLQPCIFGPAGVGPSLSLLVATI